MSRIVFYRCEICDNVVALLKNGGGELVCCGQPMTKLEPNTTDGAKEKHIPVVARANGKITAVVGSTLHPILPEHHIEWIALDAGDTMDFAYLRPGAEPKAEFAGANTGTVYGYCNLHGLWKADF